MDVEYEIERNILSNNGFYFRVWDKKNGEWVVDAKCPIIDENHITEFGLYKNDAGEIVFENDIAEQKFFGDKCIGMVKYIIRDGKLALVCGKNSPTYNEVFPNIKVIGNPHDNPELMDKIIDYEEEED